MLLALGAVVFDVPLGDYGLDSDVLTLSTNMYLAERKTRCLGIGSFSRAGTHGLAEHSKLASVIRAINARGRR